MMILICKTRHDNRLQLILGEHDLKNILVSEMKKVLLDSGPMTEANHYNTNWYM